MNKQNTQRDMKLRIRLQPPIHHLSFVCWCSRLKLGFYLGLKNEIESKNSNLNMLAFCIVSSQLVKQKIRWLDKCKINDEWKSKNSSHSTQTELFILFVEVICLKLAAARKLFTALKWWRKTSFVYASTQLTCICKCSNEQCP